MATTADTAPIAGFTLEHPGIGVSVNRLYGHQGARKFLTKVGATYKADLIDAVSKLILPIQWPSVMEEVYCNAAWVQFHLTIYADIRNPTWRHGGGLTKNGNRRSPMRKLDASNYVKLIEDSVAEAVGIDDSVHMGIIIRKYQSVEPRIIIKYEVFEAWVEQLS